LYSSGSAQIPVLGSCEHGNKPPRSIKSGEYFDQLGNY